MTTESGNSPLSGKVALVTGASRGLGPVIARELAAAGADLALNYNKSRSPAESLGQGLRGSGRRVAVVPGDMSRATDVHRLTAEVLEKLGSVDILVHNAGPYDDTPFLRLPEARWHEIFDANCTALYLLAADLAPGMRERGWGRIVSIAAQDAQVRNRSIYGLAKAALIHLSQTLAVELAPEITVNTVSPGLIAENEDLDEDLRQIAIAETPLGRLVTRQAVAAAVLGFCGPPFEHVTGQDLILDGGRVIPRMR